MKKLTLLLVAITISLFSVATYAAPMAGVVKRAIQYGEHVVVLTHEADGTPHIYRVTNGEAVAVSLTGVVARDPDNLGDYLSISDIAVTEDGKLVACNYIRCQYSDGHLVTGYKRGTSRFYIWDEIAGDPSTWFTTQTTGNSNVADVGRTFALKGTSQNAEILVTAVHNNNRAVRMDLHKVVGGEYKSDSYFTFGLHTTAAYYKEPSQGVQFQLNASATIGNWYLEGELSEPSEFVVPAGKGDAYSASAVLAEGTLGKKYNGATYLTVNGKHVMVAPYADASGNVAGVKVLDITNGLNAAELKETINLATPVAATAAATAVKADGNMLTITLVTDATLHTLTTTPDHPEEIIGVVKRAIQVGEDIIVLTHEDDGTPHIYRVTNGEVSIISQEGVLARDPDNAGDYLSISDIAVTDDGKLVACNYIRCQNADAQVDAGYKKGINRFYIWDDLIGGAREWFTEEFAANSYRADMGYTMALNGSSTACNILVTGRHYNVNGEAGGADGSVRMNYFTITNGSKSGRIYQGSTISGGNATYYTYTMGEDLQLSASPKGTGHFIMDAGKMVPSEFQVAAAGKDVTVLGRMDAATLPAQYNGATYLTIRGMHLMVAPYADGSGKVAGVKVLDITSGLDAAELKTTADLDAPVAAIATATAVQVDGNTLTITLITDATLHTLTTTIEIPEEIVGVVKRAIQLGEDIIVLTHEDDGTPHIYRVTNGVATAISQKNVVARDPDNAGDYLSISDIAITDDGKLVACNKVVCQSGDDKVDSGYKRGTTRIYKWDDLAGNPKEWFSSQHSSSWYKSIQGHTMAVKGNSTNAYIFITGVTANTADNGFRYTLFTIKDGAHSASLGAKGTGNHTTDIIGQNYELNASPFGDANYFLDGELVEPFEMICPTVSNTEVTEGTKLAAGTLGKTYNGVTYLTVNGKHLMVAPYADVSGKVGGVRVMDITNGLGAAKWLKNGVLATPASATAAATAVKSDGNTLTVTLITDATLHTFHITLDEAPVATALNPYAYNLSATWDVAAKTFTTHYTLNADAKEVYITLSDGDVEYIRKQSTGITRGAHTYAMTLTDGELAQLPSNKALTWNVITKSDKRTEVAECATNYDLLYPTSIDIDNNPKNTNFGRIIVTESRHSVKHTDGYLSTGYGAGIYAFNPDFTPAANGTEPGYNGGNTFTEKRADNNGADAYAPYRVRISDDGRIFVTSLNTNGDVLWEVNPDNMNIWTKVFTGLTQDAKKDLYNGSTFVAGPNAGFDVRGSGADLQLLMLSANTDTYGFNYQGFRVSEYNLGTATTWNVAPSKAFPHDNTGPGKSYFLAATNAQVQYDKDGGVWYVQNRSETTEKCPGLVHFTAEGVEDYKELRDNTNNAGFRFNSDFTKVVIAGGTNAVLYSVSKDADGKPVLTEEKTISISTVGRSQNDFAWDYANNLYVVGDVGKKIVAYAMPYSGEVTTPGASQHIFRVVEEVIVDENANNTTALAEYVGKEVTAKVVRNFAPNSILTLTLPFDMNATQIRTIFGNAKVYEFATIVEDDYEIHLQFNPTSSIYAGKPYLLITPTTGGYDAEDGFTIENVTITTTPAPVTVGAITMVPALDAVGTLNRNNQYYLSGGGLYNAGTYNMALVGLRAYFESTSPLPIRARVVFQDNEATSIPMVEAQSENNVRKVMKNGQLIIIRGEQKYNVQGQRME